MNHILVKTKQLIVLFLCLMSRFSTSLLMIAVYMRTLMPVLFVLNSNSLLVLLWQPLVAYWQGCASSLRLFLNHLFGYIIIQIKRNVAAAIGSLVYDMHLFLCGYYLDLLL